MDIQSDWRRVIIENKPLPEQAAEKIIMYIKDNNLMVDDKIPNEFELGTILKVGRSTVREAVRILVSRNILEIRRGAGTYVASNTGINDDPLGLTFATDEYKLAKDLLQVRLILEPEIAAIAATSATEDDILAIKTLCEKVEESILNGEDHMFYDVQLHEAIARCTDNEVVIKLIPIINSAVSVFGNVTSRKLKEETIMSHKAIVEAISSKNPTEAKYAMTMHLLYNKNKIDELIKQKDFEN